MRTSRSLLCALIPFLAPAFLHGQTVPLTAGATGTVRFNQSFNETRAIEVEVESETDLQVRWMTLYEFNVVGETGGGTLGARIYDNSGTLLASADAPISGGFNQSLTIPITATLIAGASYRIGFYLSTFTGSAGSGDFLDVDPPGLSLTPYVEPTGSFRIIQAWSIRFDSFPTNRNSFLPLVAVGLDDSLRMDVEGSCPGPVTVTVQNAPPNSEVGVVGAANNSGWTKGGANCAGTLFEIGEPFQLPPAWILVDDDGNGSAEMHLESGRCWIEAISMERCETSGASQVPQQP